jgi:hypothetical protein
MSGEVKKRGRHGKGQRGVGKVYNERIFLDLNRSLSFSWYIRIFVEYIKKLSNRVEYDKVENEELVPLHQL